MKEIGQYIMNNNGIKPAQQNKRVTPFYSLSATDFLAWKKKKKKNRW